MNPWDITVRVAAFVGYLALLAWALDLLPWQRSGQ